MDLFARVHTLPPCFLCSSLPLLSPLSAAHVRPFPRGFAFTPPLSAPCLSPHLRNQTQVCHCWGSNSSNPQAQLQKEALKTTVSMVLATQPATSAVGGKTHIHAHASPLTCPLLLFPYFTRLASPLSALNVPQLNSSTPLGNKCSLSPLPCVIGTSSLQGRQEWKRKRMRKGGQRLVRSINVKQKVVSEGGKGSR